jgi:Zn-dependent peptidase ImmA (M78 family)
VPDCFAEEWVMNEVHRNPVAAARRILDQHWLGTLPVDPGDIARSLGVRLIPMGEEKACDYSGYFRLEADGRPTVYYNVSDHSVRRRFTVAHELGHYVLGHEDAPRDLPSQFGASVSSPIERAANQFAAELLMPAEAVRKLSSSGRFPSLDALAQAFAVSKVAMGYRLKNLGLIATR